MNRTIETPFHAVLIPSIKTYVLALNEAGLRELFSFDIPTAGLDLDAGEHHYAAVREVKAMQGAGGKKFAANNYVAFDEHEPAGQAIGAAAKPIAVAPVPRVLVEMEGALILKVQSDGPIEVTFLDADLEGADEESIVSVVSAGGEFVSQRFSVTADEAQDSIEHVTEVFALIDEHSAQQVVEGKTPEAVSQRA